MRKISVVFIVLFSATFTAKAQDWAFELWHDGKIVLLAGDTLKGKVKYDLMQDILQYNAGEKVVAYSARKVLFFELFDITVHRYRQFFSLPYKQPTGYESPVFFELLEEGKLTLLAREAVENRSVSSPYYMGGSYSRLVLVYKYFFMDERGVINEFKGSKADLLDLMGRNAENVNDFIKSNRLRVEDKYDFTRIIAYYNSLYGS